MRKAVVCLALSSVLRKDQGYALVSRYGNDSRNSQFTTGSVLVAQLREINTTTRTTECRSHKSCLFMGLRGKRRRAELRDLKKQSTPALIKTPYGPIRPSAQPKPCLDCGGRGIIRCRVCEGRGLVRATGNTKHNRIGDWSRLIGSKWTSVEQRCGHRQYTVSETKGSPSKKINGSFAQVRMSNCCGPEQERVHLWISLEELRNKGMWRAGWTTLEEIKAANHGALIDAKACFLCKASRTCECDKCGGSGLINTQQILYD